MRTRRMLAILIVVIVGLMMLACMATWPTPEPEARTGMTATAAFIQRAIGDAQTAAPQLTDFWVEATRRAPTSTPIP